jgi:hypothetical protein
MSYREVQDGHGRLWQVWNTVPTSVAGALAEGFAAGWLTFECEEEKRRLAPIPEGWEHAADEHLLALLRDAQPVHRPNRQARADSAAAAAALRAEATEQALETSQ